MPLSPSRGPKDLKMQPRKDYQNHFASLPQKHTYSSHKSLTIPSEKVTLTLVHSSSPSKVSSVASFSLKRTLAHTNPFSPVLKDHQLCKSLCIFHYIIIYIPYPFITHCDSFLSSFPLTISRTGVN